MLTRKNVQFKFFFLTVCLVLAGGPGYGYETHDGGNVSGLWSGTHYISKIVTVPDDQTLTVAAGAVIKFAANTGMKVNGILRAKGLTDAAIVFTAANDSSYGETIQGIDGLPDRGYWQGIHIDGNSVQEGIGEFEHCRIRYGGNSSGLADANIYFAYCNSGYFVNGIVEYGSQVGIRLFDSSPSVTASSFAHNSSHGIYVSGSSSAPVITDNVFTSNTGYGAYLNDTPLKSYSGNTGTGNQTNGFGLKGTVTGQHTWSSTEGFPFILTGTVTVNDDQKLTLAAGTVIKAQLAGFLKVFGTLDANGADGNPVVLTSVKDDVYGGDANGDGNGTFPAPGDWHGIYLDGNGVNDGVGEFDHCSIWYGGNSGGTADANIYFSYSNSGHFKNSVCEYSSQDGIKSYDSSPVITDSVISHSGLNGLNAFGGSSPVIDRNAFNDNGQYGVYLNNVPLMSYSGNTGAGNMINGFGLKGTLMGEQIWTLGADTFPFILTGTVTVSDDQKLTLTPGMIIKAETAGFLKVFGTLDASGEAEKPVIFTSLKDDAYGGDANSDGSGTSPAAGDWHGIHLDGNGVNDGIGEFDHSRIRYGGNSGGTADANIYFAYCHTGRFADSISEHSSQNGIKIFDSSPAIMDSVITHSGGDGLYIFGASNPIITGNVFSHNSGYGVYFNNPPLPSLSGNTGEGNTFNGMGLKGTITGEVTWSAGSPAFPFILTGTVTVNDDQKLTLSPGVLIKAETAGQMTVNGTLSASGTETNPIVFTSIKDDAWGGDTNSDGGGSFPEPGNWSGIYINGSGTYEGLGMFDWCFIRYGGNSTGLADANVYFYYSDAPGLHFFNSVSEFSATDGLKIYESSPMIRGSRISDNSGDGVYVGKGTPDLGTTGAAGNNALLRNGEYDMYHTAGNTIMAEMNYWGYTTAEEITDRIYASGASVVDFDPWLNADGTMRCGPPDLGKVIQTLGITSGVPMTGMIYIPCLDAVADGVIDLKDAAFELREAGLPDGR
jgi:parallel beta-helix repeat protein